MSGFGTLFRVTTYGESHCKSVGCIVEGCPPGLPLVESDIQKQLSRRRPGQSNLTTQVSVMLESVIRKAGFFLFVYFTPFVTY